MKTREGRTVRIGSARKGYRIWLETARAEAEAAEAAYLAEHRVVLSEIESAQRRGALLYADGEIARHAPVAPMGLVEVARRRRVDPLVRRALA